MNILYIAGINYKQKAGLFNAVINRLSIINQTNNIKVYSLLEEDSFLKKSIKKLLNKKENIIEVKEFIEAGVKCENIVFTSGLISILNKEKYNKEKINYYIEAVEKYIKENKVDIIHAHWAYPHGYVAMKLSEKYNIPYVITSHGSDIHSINNNFIKEKTVQGLNNSDKAIFVSESLKNEAIKIGYKSNKWAINYNGLNHKRFFEDKNKDNKIPKIGYVGNLVDVKGVEYLPKIFNQVNKNMSCDFVIAGDGVLKEQIKSEMNNYNVACEFLGHISNEEVAKLLRTLDILVLPSKNEGWPCIISEANASGVYIVASNAGGIPEAVGNVGSIIEHGKDFEEKFGDEIVQILKRGYDKNELIKWGKNFSWDKIASEEINIYKNIIKKRYI